MLLAFMSIWLPPHPQTALAMIEPLENRIAFAAHQLYIDFSHVPQDALTVQQENEIRDRVAEKASGFDCDVIIGSATPVNGLVAVDIVEPDPDHQGIGGSGGYTPNVGGWGYAYTFGDNLAWNVKYIAENISHELIGHNAGNLPDRFLANGKYDPGTSLVAPVMGSSYFSQRGIWYPDELPKLYSRLGTHVDIFGRIEMIDDADSITFDWAGGQFKTNVKPVVGGMADMYGSLIDNDHGVTLASQDPANRLGMGGSGPLALGNYTLLIQSHYIGQYTFAPGGALPAPAAFSTTSIGILHSNYLPDDLNK